MVLVTGGTGLTGSHLLLHLLENGEIVRAVFRDDNSIQKTKSLFNLHNKSHMFEKIEWHQSDITDVPALELAFMDIDYVYHCAGLISFDPNDEEKLRKTNIEGTSNIVNLCIANHIKKLCHVSSIAALGDLKANEKFYSEETEWNPEKPHNDYAISKYGAEMEIWRGQQEGLEIVIINPGVILGAGFWNAGSGEIFSLVKKGLKFYTMGTTGFVNVKDVIVLMHKLMNSNVTGERIIAVAENISFRDILYNIADAMKVKRPDTYAKPWMSSLAWRVDWLVSKISGSKRRLTQDDSHALHTTTMYSNEKAQRLFNFEFTDVKTSVKEIVKLQSKAD